MASRRMNGVMGVQMGLISLAGYFAVDGASAVSSQVPAAGAFSAFTITKPAGTGIYRATLADGYNDIVYADGVVLAAAGTVNLDIQPIDTIVPGTGVVEFQVRNTSAGAAVDPTSVKFMLHIIAKNSQVTP